LARVFGKAGGETIMGMAKGEYFTLPLRAFALVSFSGRYA